MPRLPSPRLPALLLACGLLACEAREPDRASAPAPSGEDDVVEVLASDYAFSAPTTIPSGWTRFRLVNRGSEPHFFLLSRLPDGKTIEDYGNEVGPPFGQVWEALKEGSVDKVEAGAMLGRLLPAWYADVVPAGGVGMLSPGRSATATTRLVPGEYVMECYVKTPDGRFHTELGMAFPITVTNEETDLAPPAAEIEIGVGAEGMTVEGEAVPGERTVAVHVRDQPAAGLGYDVHLVRLEEDAPLESVLTWMDWMNVEGLAAPAPAPFLGGTQEVPAGETAYFRVRLEPGRYAWVSETAAEELNREFTVE